MNWVNFLHIYQPSDQTSEILEKVVNESYRPLFRGLLKLDNIKVNLNINGALTEIFAKKGYKDIIESIRELAETNRLEFTESAKYHPLLPFLKEREAARQIEKNNITNRKYFGRSYDPVCFFPPEMAYSPSVGKIVSKMGYGAIIIDEISYDKGKNYPEKNSLFTIKGTDLKIVFRERRISNSIMAALVRNRSEFRDLIKEDLGKEMYMCTAMDGETFGHHRPGLEKSLFEILESEDPKQLFFSDIIKAFPEGKAISPSPSTWASTVEDIEKNVQFYSWKDPKNKVHKIQWRFLNFLIDAAGKRKLSSGTEDKIDRAMASDQFFWASGEPWWSIEMIEKGAWSILRTLASLPGITEKDIEKGEAYYKEILSTAFWWQRSGKIERLARKYREAIRIPFKERTLEVGGAEAYKTVISSIKNKMEEEAEKKNYERAILWRDAIWKLETKNDIYDLVHVVDLLRMGSSEEFRYLDPKLNELFQKYKEKYNRIKPGQPEKRKA